MATWSDFKLISAQTVIFTPHDPSFNSSKILAKFLPKVAEKFNGELNVLPQLPTQTALHIPQIILKSGDGFWQLNVSTVRVDIIWLNGAGAERDWIGYVQECAAVLKVYASLFDVKANRMALVTNRVCRADDPPKELINRFCNQKSQEGPFAHSRAFEVHNFKTYDPKRKLGSSVNSWIRCKAGENANKENVIIVENDLNTLENEPSLFDSEKIGEFFIAAPLEINDIGRLYFG